MTYQERLLDKYRDIIASLEKGDARIDVDEDAQEMIAELFTSAAIQLHLQMGREEQDALTQSLQDRHAAPTTDATRSE